MPDKKLKDNEIIKVLECCSKPVGENCKECPLHLTDCLKVSIEELALDLINRQQADLKVSNEALNNSIKLNNRLQSQNKDLAETTHNLTIEKDALFDKAEELKAEVDRLNALVKTKNKLIEGLDQSIGYAYDRAIKEFATRLKCGVSITSGIITCDDIDNLVKEMIKE